MADYGKRLIAAAQEMAQSVKAHPMTDAEIAELRAGLANLPAGPWRAEKHDMGGGIQITAADDGPVFRAYGDAFSTQGWRRDMKTATIAAKYALSVQPSAIRALLARLDAAEGGWQDIATAPKDGTQFLATGGGLGDDVDIVSYNDRVGCWDATNYTLDDTDHETQGYNRPTHWRPLPAPAKAEG